jgi:DNA-binding SARP family transcriptional activator/tetratricopeptide (TPR) repeat protein
LEFDVPGDRRTTIERAYGRQVQYQILGPLEVWNGSRRVGLGGPQPAKALAVLLLAGGNVAPLDALIDALWDGVPPPTAKHQVHKLIAHLRRQLAAPIETDGPGYRIGPAPAELDATRFADHVTTGSVASLRAALALWRGPALSGLDSRALRVAAAALDERRLDAAERLADLRLAAGEPAAEIAADLTPLVEAHPLRETLRSRLMVALQRCGRRADALAVYAHTRTLLATELGLDPGPELVRTHLRLLRADPALDPPAPVEPVPAGPARPLCTLPYDLPDFNGRDADLDTLHGTGDTGGAVLITAIDGMAGVGKTALAVHAAHRLAGRYPDAQLFCDLHAHTPGTPPLDPETALGLLLRMLRVPPDTIPDGLAARTARWRAELAGRRVLVVLDNAVSAAQVRPLLPGTPGCLVLLTSRHRLGVVEGASVLSLDVLSPAEALDLFGAVAGSARVAAEPTAAASVVRLCGYLPLAIRVAATRLVNRPRWTVAGLAARLGAESGRLGELTLHDRGVGPAFALSYACLEPAQQRLFRLLGRHPGADFDAHSVAALAATTPQRAEELLESLVDTHLLSQPAPGRYSFHDLLREYARMLDGPEGPERPEELEGPEGPDGLEGPEPIARLHGYYLAAVTAATDRVAPDSRWPDPPRTSTAHLPPLADVDAALSWLDSERATLVALASAVDDWRLACVLRVYFEHRGHFADWRVTHEHALRAARGDAVGTTLIRFGLGACAMWTGRLDEGLDHFRHATRSADPRLRATALTSMGMLAHLLHRDVEAAGHLHRALAITQDNPRTTALALNNLGLAEGRLGRRDAALDHHRRALTLARQAGSRGAERAILLGLGETSLRLGVPAEEPFRRARDLARRGRFRMQEALALDGLAHATGERWAWRAALAIFTDLGVARAGLVRAHLDSPGTPCCDLCRVTPPVDVTRPRAGASAR